jgi:hypothetical protein
MPSGPEYDGGDLAQPQSASKRNGHLTIFTRLKTSTHKNRPNVASRRKIEEANLRSMHRGSLVSACADGSS